MDLCLHMLLYFITPNRSPKVFCHGNAIQESEPYFRTSKGVLEKAKEILSKGIGAKKLYGQINSESGSVFSRAHKAENSEILDRFINNLQI